MLHTGTGAEKKIQKLIPVFPCLVCGSLVFALVVFRSNLAKIHLDLENVLSKIAVILYHGFDCKFVRDQKPVFKGYPWPQPAERMTRADINRKFPERVQQPPAPTPLVSAVISPSHSGVFVRHITLLVARKPVSCPWQRSQEHQRSPRNRPPRLFPSFMPAAEPALSIAGAGPLQRP
jgi:hypothetical protein